MKKSLQTIFIEHPDRILKMTVVKIKQTAVMFNKNDLSCSVDSF